jgi:hypothetical protein
MTREWLRLVDRYPMAFMALVTVVVLGGLAAGVARLVGVLG